MAGLETVVRPFQTPSVTLGQVTEAPAAQPPPVHIWIGRKGGSVKLLNAHNSFSETFYCDKHPREVIDE
jgi:hypothetical protein